MNQKEDRLFRKYPPVWSEEIRDSVKTLLYKEQLFVITLCTYPKGKEKAIEDLRNSIEVLVIIEKLEKLHIHFKNDFKKILCSKEN